MIKTHKVMVLGNVREEGLQILREFADITVLPEAAPKQDIIEKIPDMDAILHKFAKIDGDVVAAQTKLQLIARHGVGLDDLDIDAINAAGIPVSITPAANSNAVAEATVGLALMAIRKFSLGEEMIKIDRRWERENLMGRELSHCTVGIIGFGRIGQRVARIFQAFGSEIIIHDANSESLVDCPYDVSNLETVLSRADIVCLHCPLLPSTRHLINEARLKLMKKSAILVNTSRGGLVDSKALTAAVSEGKIAGAALDVFASEPPDFNDPLFREKNIVATPHVAAMTVEAQIAMAVLAAKEIQRVLMEGLPPTNNIFS